MHILEICWWNIANALPIGNFMWKICKTTLKTRNRNSVISIDFLFLWLLHTFIIFFLLLTRVNECGKLTGKTWKHLNWFMYTALCMCVLLCCATHYVYQHSAWYVSVLQSIAWVYTLMYPQFLSVLKASIIIHFIRRKPLFLYTFVPYMDFLNL